MTKRALLLSFLLLVGGGALCACTSGRASDAYSGSDEAMKASRTSKEVCLDSCNSSFDRCGDSTASHEHVEGTNGLFGAPADCRSALSKCLRACKGL